MGWLGELGVRSAEGSEKLDDKGLTFVVRILPFAVELGLLVIIVVVIRSLVMVVLFGESTRGSTR
jgi:hypothetical protein